MSKIKVVLIGTGNIAKTHAAALKEVPGTELYGVFDVNANAAESFAREFGASKVFTTLEAAAASEADSVHVLTPPDYHLSTAMPFVRASKRAAGQSLRRIYRRDLLSRGILARFDCSATKHNRDWKPVADPAEFHFRALAVHAEL